MTTINRSALLPFSAERVYGLINDIEAYPQYMDGCVGAEILFQSESMMEARLDLSKKGVKYSFTTQNQLEAPVLVKMQLVDGPFSRFQGEWRIKPLSDKACKVSLTLEFTLAGKVLGLAAKALFNPMADNLVDALVRRAGDVC